MISSSSLMNLKFTEGISLKNKATVGLAVYISGAGNTIKMTGSDSCETKKSQIRLLQEYNCITWRKK